MTNCFSLEIVTSERSVFKGEAASLSLFGALGSMTILAHHAPLITELRKGPIFYTTADGEEKTMELNGGFIEVAGNRVTVLDR